MDDVKGLLPLRVRLAYVVTQRVQEIGVRLAIGAAPRDVVRLLVREGALRLTGAQGTSRRDPRGPGRGLP